jgi:hypothetical protein
MVTTKVDARLHEINRINKVVQTKLKKFGKSSSQDCSWEELTEILKEQPVK